MEQGSRMSDRQVRRERRERWLQGMAFAGAVLVLAAVLYASAITRRQQRENDRRLTALPVPSLRATPGPTLETTPDHLVIVFRDYQQFDAFLFAYPEPSSVLDPARLRGRTSGFGVFLGLTQWDWRFTMQRTIPVLAQSWEVSEDGRVYTFHLRRDVSWVRCDPGGEETYVVRPVTADDLLFAIERSLRPETGALGAEVLYPIQGAQERQRGDSAAPLGVEALDPYTVRFTLVTPTLNFPTRLAEPLAWPVPREPIEQFGDAWTEPGKIWVDGPFCPIAWEPGREVRLIPNLYLPAELSQEVGTIVIWHGNARVVRYSYDPAYPGPGEVSPTFGPVYPAPPTP